MGKSFFAKYYLQLTVGTIVLIGLGVALFLSFNSQEIRQQASRGAVYQVCAGGVTEGGKACDTGTSLVTCHNGSFGSQEKCGSGQICRSGACITSTASTSCAGGVENSKTACDTGTSYVTCNNGSFGSSHACPAGQICRNGSCGATTAAAGCSGGIAEGKTSCDREFRLSPVTMVASEVLSIVVLIKPVKVVPV